MRNIMKVGCIAILLMMHAIVSGQERDVAAQLRMEIDSIAKVHNLTEGIVNFHRIGSRFDNTYTDTETLSIRDAFDLKGQFLVIGTGYYNLNKLLFFKVKQNYIEFYFQGY